MSETPAIALNDEQVEAISRAVADPRRFAILRQIAQCEHLLCGALEAHACLSPATVSHHLTVLEEAGLIETAREGRNVKMTLRRPIWQAYLDRLAAL